MNGQNMENDVNKFRIEVFPLTDTCPERIHRELEEFVGNVCYYGYCVDNPYKIKYTFPNGVSKVYLKETIFTNELIKFSSDWINNSNSIGQRVLKNFIKHLDLNDDYSQFLKSLGHTQQSLKLKLTEEKQKDNFIDSSKVLEKSELHDDGIFYEFYNLSVNLIEILKKYVEEKHNNNFKINYKLNER